jgi:hypothetical protein
MKTAPERRRSPLRSAAAVYILTVGALISSARAAEDAPVSLPPFLVEEVAKGPPWRYTEAMGYEVLSRCNDATTRRVVAAHHQLHVLLAEILPPSLQLELTTPRALILYDQELQPAASQEVIQQMLRNTPSDADSDFAATPITGRGLRMPVQPARRYSFLPNLRLWDRDSMTVFMIVRRDDFDSDRLALTHDYISFLVRSRLPALPVWFTSGFLSLYGQTTYAGGHLAVAPFEWISATHTAAVKKDPKMAPPLQPLGDFFGAVMPTVAAPPSYEPKQAWQAQATLFVRWGLDAGGREERAAFWKFTERAATEGVSEKLFIDCFGFDYAAAEAQLTTYLQTAVRRALEFKPAQRAKLPPLALRNASDGEISRLKGDWERLEIAYVKARYPQLASKYLVQARRTLHRAYDRADRDPRLLAVLGLCEVDAGNDAAAREYLEAAAAAGSIRPRANYELARLRFAEARAASGGKEDKLSVSQMAAILKPLFAARADQPPLPEVYELICETWEQGMSAPTRRHLAVLDEGVRLFPRRAAFVLRVAELNLRHGFEAEAAALVEIGVRTADERTRDQFLGLQKRLAK